MATDSSSYVAKITPNMDFKEVEKVPATTRTAFLYV